MRDRSGRGYGDRGEMRGQGRGMWQGRGGFGMRGGRGYGFGCEQNDSGVVLEALNIKALHPAYLAHLAQQNYVFVCVQQQDGLGVKGPRMVAADHRGLGRGFGIAQGYGRAGHDGRKGQGCGCEGHEGHGHGCEDREGRGWGYGRKAHDGQGFGREGREGQGLGYGPESRGWGGALEARGYGHGREQSCASSDSSSPFQVLSVNIPRGEVAQTSAAFTPRVTVHIESSQAQHLNEQAGVSDPVAVDVTAAKKTTVAHIKERHTVADVVAAGLCTSCSDCVALCGRRQAISMQTNDAGDLVPVVDMSLCNLCGKCYRKCPAILETQSSQH